MADLENPGAIEEAEGAGERPDVSAPEDADKMTDERREEADARAKAEEADAAEDKEAAQAIQAANDAEVEGAFEKDVSDPTDQQLADLAGSSHLPKTVTLDETEQAAIKATEEDEGTPLPDALRTKLKEAWDKSKEAYKAAPESDESDEDSEDEDSEDDDTEESDEKPDESGKKTSTTPSEAKVYSDDVQGRLQAYIDGPAKNGWADKPLLNLLDRFSSKFSGKDKPSMGETIAMQAINLAAGVFISEGPATKDVARLAQPKYFNKRRNLEAAGLHVLVNEETGEATVEWKETNTSLPKINLAHGIVRDVMGDAPAARLLDNMPMDTTVDQFEGQIAGLPADEQENARRILTAVQKVGGEGIGEKPLVDFLQNNSLAVRAELGLAPKEDEKKEEAEDEKKEEAENPMGVDFVTARDNLRDAIKKSIAKPENERLKRKAEEAKTAFEAQWKLALTRDETFADVDRSYEEVLLAFSLFQITGEEEGSEFAKYVQEVGKTELGDSYPKAPEGVVPTFEALRMMATSEGGIDAALSRVAAAAESNGNTELAESIRGISTTAVSELLEAAATRAEKKDGEASSETDEAEETPEEPSSTTG